MKVCELCEVNRAILKRPKTGQKVCKECFYAVFEEEIHHTIVSSGLFKRGDRVAIAASGGKDSTVLAHIMTTLNARHNYGLDLCLLSIDEGISGYRDDSLETVKRNQAFYKIPLKILSYTHLYNNWSMDAIVKQVGTKNNCTYCGVFRRQAIDRGADELEVDWICTGHNADDIAETVLMNIMRGDFSRLQRCCSIATQGTPSPLHTYNKGEDNKQDATVPRCKPFKYTYESDIVKYAYHKRLDYFSTECIYSPNAYRGHARVFLKDLEAVRRSAILDIVYSGEQYAAQTSGRTNLNLGTCERCGYISSNILCKACALLEGLNVGLAKIQLDQE